MPFCPNCGQSVEESMRFCPSCGAALAAGAITGTVSGDTSYTPYGAQGDDYRLVLISCGTCTAATVRELLQNVLGYTASEASTLTDRVPAEFARMLSFQQALDIARMFTEYGMQIAVYNSSGYVDISQHATSSVFQSDGSILKTAAVSLAALTAVNRVTRFLRWTLPNPLRFLFTPRYRYQAPPPPRPIHRAPPPPAPARGVGGRGPIHRAPPPPPPAPARGIGGRGPLGGGLSGGPGSRAVGPMGGRNPGGPRGGGHRGPGGRR